MHISWNYLDKKKATVDAIMTYEDMEYIIEHTDENIVRTLNSLYGVGSPGMDGLPHVHNPKAGEEKLINGLDDIDVMKERYRQAVEYMSWFKPAWEKLSEDDRYILDVLFRNREIKGGTQLLADYFGIERKSVYLKRKRALDRLSILLYGKV